MRAIRSVSVSISAAALGLWAVDFAGSCSRWDVRLLDIDEGAAITLTLAALVLCLAMVFLGRLDALRCEYRRREQALIKTASWLAKGTAQAEPPTVPFPRVP